MCNNNVIFKTQDVIVSKEKLGSFKTEVIKNGCENSVYTFKSVLNCLKFYVGHVMSENAMCREDEAILGADIGVLLYVIKQYISDEKWDKIESSKFILEFHTYKKGTKIVISSKKFHITVYVNKMGQQIKRSELGTFIGCYYKKSFECKSLSRIRNLEDIMLSRGIVDNSKRFNNIEQEVV